MTSHRITIEGSGFINEEIEARLLSYPNINRQLVDVVISTIRFANEIALKLPVYSPHETSEEKQKVIAVTLLIRLIEIAETIIIISAYGVRQELKTLFRVFLDAYFLIANVCSDPKFVGLYFQTDETERLKLLNVAAKSDHEMFKALKQYATKDIHNTLDKKVKEEKIQAFNSYSYADKIGCAHLYDSLYRLMSPSVHTGPRCLEDYVEGDPQGNITKILHTGNLDETHRFLYDTTWFLLKALNGICELFEYPDLAKIVALEAELKTTMKVYEDPQNG
jgi:hypothetical protein